MHRFPPLPPQIRLRRRPPISLTLANLPLGELTVLSLLALLLACA